MEADAIVGEERITCGMLHGIPIELETTRKQRNDKTQQHKPQQNNNSPWIGILIVMCSSLQWTTPHFCGGFLLKNTTIGFSHTPKPSPMTSGHHTSWNSDMKDNHSLVSIHEKRIFIDYHLQHPIYRKPQSM